MSRRLVTIQRIEEIKEIEGADKICACKVKGWQVVVEKGLHQIDDYVIYCEIDSWIPTEVAPFLSKGKEPKEYNGVKGEKLRTIRLKGQISQGLILPFKALSDTQFNSILNSFKQSVNNEIQSNYEITAEDINFKRVLYTTQFDLSEALGIQKWEAPIPANMGGKVKGNFPSFIRKTDQERVQNLWKDLKANYNNEGFEVSVKLDGTSFTCYFNNGIFGVCSRNLELQEEEGNLYWKIAHQYKLQEKLSRLGKNLAIQGEIIGEGIQKNKENLKGHHLYIFDIYNIDTGKHLTRGARLSIIDALDNIQVEENEVKLNPIPTLEYIARKKLRDLEPQIADKRQGTVLSLSTFNTLEELLAIADGESINSTHREGIVFKSLNEVNGEVISFKVISNEFLLKYE